MNRKRNLQKKTEHNKKNKFKTKPGTTEYKNDVILNKSNCNVNDMTDCISHYVLINVIGKIKQKDNIKNYYIPVSGYSQLKENIKLDGFIYNFIYFLI